MYNPQKQPYQRYYIRLADGRRVRVQNKEIKAFKALEFAEIEELNLGKSERRQIANLWAIGCQLPKSGRLILLEDIEHKGRPLAIASAYVEE